MNTAPSSTPETDAEGVRFGRIAINWRDGGQAVTELVPADFARKLEAERNMLIEAMEELAAWCDHFAPITYPILTRVRAVLAKTRSTDRRE